MKLSLGGFGCIGRITYEQLECRTFDKSLPDKNGYKAPSMRSNIKKGRASWKR